MQGDDATAGRGLQVEKTSSAPPQAPLLPGFKVLVSFFLLIVALAVVVFCWSFNTADRSFLRKCEGMLHVYCC